MDDDTATELSDLREERDAAIKMLAAWCVAVDKKGGGWDDWDEHYKDAAYRETEPPILRSLLNAAMAKIGREYDEL